MNRQTAHANRSWRAAIVGLLAALAAASLVLLLAATGSEISGADDAAGDAVLEIAAGMEPWAEPLWSPPDDDVETALFALQAAAGAGFLGYFFSRRRQIG